MPVRIDEASLDKYVKTLDSFSKTNFVSSEINTRRKLIEPLLELLAWDIRGDEIDFEFPVKIGTSNPRVDYAFIRDNKPVVFVEAKSLDTELLEEQSQQVISYGRVEGVRWVALTNGKRIKIFDTNRGKTQKESLVCEIDLKNPSKYLEELAILHKESIITGETEKITDRILQRRLAISKIKERQNELSEGITKVITGIIGEVNKEQAIQVASQLAMQAIGLFEKKTSEVIPKPGSQQEVRVTSLTPVIPQDKKLRTTWTSGLDWVNPEARELTLKMKDEIIKNFMNAIHKPSGTDYQFYKNRKSSKSTFVALMLRKTGLMIRVIFDPNKSVDKNKMLKEKIYKGWFFNGNGQEREFYINNVSQIGNAMELVKQSYEIAE